MSSHIISQESLCLDRFIAGSAPKWNISFCNSLVSYIILTARVGPGDLTSCISEHHESCTKLVTFVEITWLHRISSFFFPFFFLFELFFASCSVCHLSLYIYAFICHYKSVIHVISNLKSSYLTALFITGIRDLVTQWRKKCHWYEEWHICQRAMLLSVRTSRGWRNGLRRKSWNSTKRNKPCAGEEQPQLPSCSSSEGPGRSAGHQIVCEPAVVSGCEG